nr:hypothetical protein [uncultured Mediterraneibacter sp.]
MQPAAPYSSYCNNIVPSFTCTSSLLFTPMSITPLIGMEDARFVLNVSRPSP